MKKSISHQPPPRLFQVLPRGALSALERSGRAGKQASWSHFDQSLEPLISYNSDIFDCTQHHGKKYFPPTTTQVSSSTPYTSSECAGAVWEGGEDSVFLYQVMAAGIAFWLSKRSTSGDLRSIKNRSKWSEQKNIGSGHLSSGKTTQINW